MTGFKPSTGKLRTATFKVIALLLPLVFLLLLEGALRFFGYGENLSIFIDQPGQKDYLILNPRVSDRYFGHSDNATQGNQEPFAKQKKKGTFRVFVLGESTTIGYPYMHNGAFHRWLSYRLMHTFPEMDFEIINLAMTAVNSYTVLDFGREIVEYEPDAVMVYTGHNEYYGALGVGATGWAGNSPSLVHFLIRCRQLRFVQLADKLGQSVLKLFGKKAVDKSENLMKRMVLDQEIEINSNAYRAGIEQFDKNMSELCEVLSAHRIPTFLSDLVSNEKDLKPFISDNRDSSRSADIQFKLGRISYRNGDFISARKHLIAAKELDLLRFRAPEALNKSIHKLAKDYPLVKLVETNRNFRQYSPNGILGENTLLEHVHPNLFGYALMAQSFYQALEESEILPFKGTREWSFDEMRSQMPITKVDSLQGQYEIMILKEGWPFYQEMPKEEAKPKSIEEQLAGALAIHQISWRKAMEALLISYAKAKNSTMCLKICEALMLEFPHEIKWYDEALKFSMAENDSEKTINYLQRAFKKEPNYARAQKAFVALLKLDRPKQALPFLQYALKNGHKPSNLQELETIVQHLALLKDELQQGNTSIELHNQIASAYLQFGNYSVAEKYISYSLALKPHNEEALKLKSQIETAQGTN
ncbi:hypothetical protein LAG90_17845 [Marinilongibacter aquaticus]|uniref:hypothetical protein n=1 Tax=Marinilongibacter aquaticus TaxID=2975157 RepID=UPI0021BD5CE6|nr:hypothetical protein [Marinilongibacter aquaticus]UBM58666.1 hypothetical protein LAG90_17845 [Marinilongibacter aquaticus]